VTKKAVATAPAKKPAPAAKPAKAPKEKVEKVKKPGIGEFVKAQIMAGKDNAKIIEMVSLKFPDAKTTNASVNWYRSKLRNDGEEVPSSRVPKAAKAPAAKVAAPAAKKAAPVVGKKPVPPAKKATKDE